MYETFGAVIPAYNEAEGIAKTLERIRRYLRPEHIVVVDDGSDDDTASIARAQGVHVIRNERNRGKGKALSDGFGYITAIENVEATFTLDADGQHDPDEIPSFIDSYRRHHVDILIGNRMHTTTRMPHIRIFTNRLTSAIVSLRTGCRIEDSQSGYRLIRTSILRNITLVTSHYETESEILIKAGKKGAVIESIPIRTIYAGERSTINPFIDTVRFFILVIRCLFW
ncbi:MAG: glycosyltransferase family 2 protein [bacterium]|nr:MAG: glycosyltransferase family 2 protein [bacterium]